MRALLQRLVKVRDDEVGALLWSFTFFFTLLASYSIMRPLRDEMGVASGSKNLPWLFTATFVSMAALVPLYTWVVARVPRLRLVPIVYHFFALNLVIFFVLWRAHVAPLWTARVFFVWVSVYNLFIVSMLWSVMADTWRSEQGQRLFGFIAAGGSLGAILGPTITTALVGLLGPANLILVSAVLLEVSVLCVRQLSAYAARSGGGEASKQPIGGGILAGIKHTLTSPFLLNIAIVILLFTSTSTFLYSQQNKLFESLITDRAERTRIFGMQDIAINSVTFATQVGLTGRIVAALGVGVSLAVMPVFTALSFGSLLVWPTVMTVVVFQAARRALHFAIDRPAREVLFTAVPREDKYKSKNFIDTVVYRGGDVLSAWAFPLLAGMAGPVAIGLSLIWLVVVTTLARRYAARQGAPS